ncbi:MAG: tetratricopeptide repeat protein [Xanthomonadaceae bacterium]|nr:tetratricopeptide repeat protein [Xanthomonadaceae bacterium]
MKTAALLFLFAICPLSLSAKEMSIIEQFEHHVDKAEWAQALPLIQEIVQRAPHIATSWRNLGVVLDELGRHAEAANAFRRAYDLDPKDYGTQYRVFRSLSLAKDSAGFLQFAENEAEKDQDIVEIIADSAEFSEIIQSTGFQSLLKKHSPAGG